MTMRIPDVEIITVGEWVDESIYPAYYANKNVIPKMKQAHLNGEISSPHMMLVSCFEYQGLRCKIDGHSRAEAWRREQLQRPEQLKLTIYYVDSLGEAAALYQSMNSKTGAETARERADHFNKLAEFEPKSKLLSAGMVSVYKCLMHSAANEGEVIAEYKQELLEVDSWMISVPSRGTAKSLANVGIKAAILKTVKKNPVLAKDFWLKYFNPEDNTSAEVNCIRNEVIAHQGRLGGAVIIGTIYGLGQGQFNTYCDKRS